MPPRLPLFALLGLALACDANDRPGTRADAWALAAEPLFAVGDTAEAEAPLLVRATDARQLPNGDVIVADAGAWAVLVFDATGRLRARLGRRGRGPGEFTGDITLARRGDDAVAVWDPGQDRWSEVVTPGDSLRTLGPDGGDAAWTHAGLVVFGEASPPAWLPAMLRGASDSLPQARHAFLDETALLWINADSARRDWRAFDDSGEVGAVLLPPDFAPTQFAGDRVVGLAVDSLGLQRVLVLGFKRPAGIPPRREPAATAPADSGQRASLMSALRTAVVAQEMFYAGHSSYTMAADSLTLEMPPGARLRILEASRRGWSGTAMVEATGFTCGMMVGTVAPRGWTEGVPHCGW